jgi:hypothetical protein
MNVIEILCRRPAQQVFKYGVMREWGALSMAKLHAIFSPNLTPQQDQGRISLAVYRGGSQTISSAYRPIPLKEKTMRQRTIVCPLIQNEGHYRSAKWPPTAGFSRAMGLIRRRRGARAAYCSGAAAGSRAELGEKLILTHIARWSFRDDTRVNRTSNPGRNDLYE